MLSNNRKTRVVQPMAWLGVTMVLATLPLQAHAYLDPTTGSMLISAIVGLFASLVLALKTYWYRIKSFFKRKPQAVQNEPPQDDEAA